MPYVPQSGLSGLRIRSKQSTFLESWTEKGTNEHVHKHVLAETIPLPYTNLQSVSQQSPYVSVMESFFVTLSVFLYLRILFARSLVTSRAVTSH